MKNILFVILLALLLVGCGTSESAVQTAIAETAAANPTNTYTPIPSDTPSVTPSPTFTLTPSETPTVTAPPTETETLTPEPTATPTPDLRVIAIEPKEFLLGSDDLPKEAKYYLPNSNWISPHHNTEIISGWGTEEGKAYLDETGRIDGWVASYKRGTSTVIAPEEIYNNIIQYKTAEGAQIVVTKYDLIKTNRAEGFHYVDRELEDFGDVYVLMERKIMQSNGKNRMWYQVSFAYRNYVSTVRGYGWESDIDYDYVEDIARTSLEKLKAAPLVDEIP